MYIEIMKKNLCDNGCCEIKIKPYKETNYIIKKSKKKAGVFIYDPNSKKILIIQSRGNLWGSPKGSLEYGESEIECAIREVIEETGITITEELLTRSVKICNIATYFYLEMNECSLKIQKHNQNDATGIAWIKPECLKKSIESGNIRITHHFRILAKFFGFYL
jgi:8-oxo-dGTP pyrophosphatase MutT (NUDIX family)